MVKIHTILSFKTHFHFVFAQTKSSKLYPTSTGRVESAFCYSLWKILDRAKYAVERLAGKERELNSAANLASQPAANHSLNLIITVVIMTLGWGLFVGLATESCCRIWLPCLSETLHVHSRSGIQCSGIMYVEVFILNLLRQTNVATLLYICRNIP